jgi:DNA gyrase subunit A
MKGPDFPGGGYILYDETEIQKIYNTGRGSVRVRSHYSFDKENGCIEVTRIPPSTTVEAIMDKIVDLIKQGKIKEISYIRDETDINGLKLTIDIKRGTDPDKLMKKLFRMTPLEDSYSCNFNVLIGGTPKVMGIYEILEEWTAFRTECVKRRLYFELKKKKDKLHLLKGLKKILLDIDRAVKIVRETEEESDVVPNLMIGFGIDEPQAEYVAEIKLRHLNGEYILNRIAEIEELEKDIAGMEDVLGSPQKIKNLIISELREVSKKYGEPRKTLFYYNDGEEEDEEDDGVPDYGVNLFLSRSGYFKKITPQSLRMSGEQKLKEGDVISDRVEANNKDDLLFFSDRNQVYKTKAGAFEDSKASLLGDYIPAKLGFDEGENVRSMVVTSDYSGYVLMIFENGKAARVPLSSYETKTNRKKLTGAYTDKSKLVRLFYIRENADILIRSDNGRALAFNTGMILPKAARDTVGVQVMTLKKGAKIENAFVIDEASGEEMKKYYIKSVPAAGAMAKELKDPDQLSFL